MNTPANVSEVDILSRHIREKRARLALRILTTGPYSSLIRTCLFVCGGTGDTSNLFMKTLNVEVTVTDISEEMLSKAREITPGIQTKVLDAERLDMPDGSYDLVVVQDGLHHLSRPALGLAEMLRVARKAIVVIEPAAGFAARLFGKKYEHVDGKPSNYVFRWNYRMFASTVRSYMVNRPHRIIFRRFWYHNMVISRLAGVFGRGPMAVFLSKVLEFVPSVLFPLGGNQMLGIVLFDSTEPKRN